MGQARDSRQIVYGMIRAAAERGELAPSNLDLSVAIGSESDQTPLNIINRLVSDGLIRVHRYQRARVIEIISTGQRTTAPKSTTPHWRASPRPHNIPSTLIPNIRTRDPVLLNRFLAAAALEKITIGDFLAELVWTGWQVYETDSKLRKKR